MTQNNNNQDGYNSRMKEMIGEGKELLASQLATNRSILQKCILVKEKMIFEDNIHFSKVSLQEVANVVLFDLSQQWMTVSPLLRPPVIISEEGIVNKTKRLWEKAVNVCRDRTSKGTRQLFLRQLDKLFDITACQHKIVLCGQHSGTL